MNLLNSVLLIEQIRIKKEGIPRLWIIIIISILLGLFLFLYEKDYYYTNNLIISDNNIGLVVTEPYINKIKQNNKIIVDNIENNYSIKKISSLNNLTIVYIKLKIMQDNIQNTEYKVYLGKEKIIEYIVRIIKNKWKK